MALQLKQSLNLAQQLIMTPQLQQAIKLLQLSRLELLETITQEMETNPLLDDQPADDQPADDQSADDQSLEDHSPEDLPADGSDSEKEFSDESVESEGDGQADAEVTIVENAREDMDWESYLSEYNTGWSETPYEGRELPSFENMTASKPSLHSHLIWQLNLNNSSETQKEIGFQIIGNIDEDGYLETTIEELSLSTGYIEEEVLETLKLIQTFDPVGIAARDTRECLLIQLRFQGLEGTIPEKIIIHHMDNLENKRYDRIAKNLAVPMEEVLSAVSVITSLEPKPGRLYNDDETIYISPDIYVFKVGDDYEIVLNEDGMPKLRINNYYKEILNSKNSLGKETREYIQEKLKSAAWLIKSIHQRQRTIYKVTESIVEFQRSFFDKGVTHLKPLVLRDVAEHIQMHESTISRVTTNKYVHTPQGVFELKYFFNSAINSMEGDSIASESVKEHIKNIVKSEDKSKPHSDQEVADILVNFNIKVARRTVAKYRETLGILPSRKRRVPC